MFFLAVGGIGSLSFWWSMNPHQPYWVITSSVAVAFGLSAYWTTMPAFLGDISDAYERKTGIVCQGLFTAIYGIAAKIGVSVSFLLTGYTLIFCRFDVKQTLEEMADPLTLMRVLFCIVPALGMALAAFSIWKCRPGEIAPMTRLDPQPSA